jgi:hypothetical protein
MVDSLQYPIAPLNDTERPLSYCDLDHREYDLFGKHLRVFRKGRPLVELKIPYEAAPA